MPRLIDLLRIAGIASDVPDVDIASIVCDSRAVTPGALFVALPGVKTDGAQFIEDALARGAAAVVSTTGPIVVENPRLALAKLAAAFYPRQPAHVVAITGTDGKTSTADFFRQLAVLRGHKAASIGTLGTLGAHGEMLYPGTHTTPDPVALHRQLQELHDAGYTHVALEASSHGLAQYRLDGVRVHAAAFTNLTRDHLDYHGTVEAYFEAKQRLFAEFPIQAAVINVDDARGAALREATKSRVIEFGNHARDLALVRQVPCADGQTVELAVLGSAHTLSIPLVGAFQVCNMLAAAGLLIACGGEKPEDILPLFPKLHGVPGRLQRVKNAPVYVDYAHTPAALAGALRTLRPHTSGRLIVVFGCGGERDAGKRPEMGKAAAELADVVIVTDDNPRSEDAAAIRRAVLAGAPGAQEIPDRRAALHAAVRMMQPGDVLLAAGKGHEKVQIISGVEHLFDDVAVLGEVL